MGVRARQLASRPRAAAGRGLLEVRLCLIIYLRGAESANDTPAFASGLGSEMSGLEQAP